MGTFRKARFGSITSIAFAATLLLSTTASAQDNSGAVGCDPNLKPAVETEEQANIRNACEAHIGCRLVFSVMRTTCRASKFLRDLADKVTPGKPIDSNMVADAATPAVPESQSAKEKIFEARLDAARFPDGKATQQQVQSPDGRSAYAEIRDSLTPGNRNGTLIYSDGAIARGTFDRNLWQYGNGQVIAADGRMQAGKFFQGKLSNPGSSVETFKEPDGRSSMLEGTFCEGRPCGEMVRRYSDGTLRREVWRGNAAVTIGETGAQGMAPPPLRLEVASLPDVVWTRGLGEGLIKVPHEGREVYFLFCNGKEMDVGLLAERGQAVPPVRRDCRQPGPDGLSLVTNTRGLRRYELWCKGKVIDDGIWSQITSVTPQFPTRRVCDEPKVVEEDDDDGIVQTDAVQHTLQVPKPRLSSGPRADRVSGPPWPCNAEYGRTRAANYQSQEQFWPHFGFSLQHAIANWAPASAIFNSYNSYMATHPGFRSEPLWYGFAQGFLSDRQYLLAFSAELDAIAHSGQYDAGTSGNVGFAACLARYKAG